MLISPKRKLLAPSSCQPPSADLEGADKVGSVFHETQDVSHALRGQMNLGIVHIRTSTQAA